MKLLRLPALFFLLLLSLRGMAAGPVEVDITRYGAKGDGLTLNTDAIQRAIDDCSSRGGGKVLFPAGNFLSGTIVLKNNITLHLDKGALLLGSTRLADYRNMDPFTDGLGIDVGWALVVAVDAVNIGIDGQGTIDGQGAKLKAEQLLTDTRPESRRWGNRPFLIRMVRCQQVRMEGVALHYSAAWTSHYFQCRNVVIRHLNIESIGVAHNDGIDIDGCQEVEISDCDILSGDDALCFKTTSSKMACRNISVSRMRLSSHQGAIKIGTESMAAFENITIRNCSIYNTNNGGIKLLSVDGARIRHILIEDITMTEVKTPMLIRLGSRLSVFRKGADSQQTTGILDDVLIRRVKAQAAANAQLMPPSGILITGVPGHPVTGLTLEDIEISLAGGGTVANSRQAVPEAVDQYPEVKTFGPLVPAYGLWARHTEGLKLKQVRFLLAANDCRPAIVCEDARDLEVTACTLPETTGSPAVIRLENISGALIRNTTVAGVADAFVRVEGTGSATVRLDGNRIPGMRKALEHP